ncbi:family 20 glycosylhydrolase [Reichenbachiella sp. MALMAid0571]|uniref:beta-N-acetylhexosaminidase n=1 Tax=Reichenbachiella sp. MALMAid0571 TaxID=3143939 RepID=UPI0032DEBCCD
MKGIKLNYLYKNPRKNFQLWLLAIIANVFTCGEVSASGDRLTDFLIPIPNKVEVSGEKYHSRGGRIVFNGINSSENRYRIAKGIQATLGEAGLFFGLSAQSAIREKVGVTLSIDKELVLKDQGYSLIISKEHIKLVAKDEAGLFYGWQTLRQIVAFAKSSGYIPVLTIKDSPDFPNRGFMWDISRDKVPKMDEIFRFIDNLASWKINQLQLYSEHTFQYQNHKVVWQQYSALTADEILQIDAYCKERFIELVPNQNSLGHMGRWLEHEEYWRIAERPKISAITPDTPSGLKTRNTLNATDPASLEFISELYSELLPNFSSNQINVGGDEPYELGYGKSKTAVEQKGKGQVYLDYLLELNKLVQANNHSMQFWGDIILKHPEYISQLPDNITAMIWGYNANHPFDAQCKVFKKAKVPFYVCPGTSSWRCITGRYDNAMKNQLSAAKNGLKYGSIGYLNTDWGDYGHWQPFVLSYPPILYGAALSWGVEFNKNVKVDNLLNKYIFKDKSGRTAEFIHELSNINQVFDPSNPSNMYFHYSLLHADIPVQENKRIAGINMEKVKNIQAGLSVLEQEVELISPACEDGEWIKNELRTAIHLAIHANKLNLAKLNFEGGTKSALISEQDKAILLQDIQQIIADFSENWVKRYRLGGLHDSVNNLNKISGFYTGAKNEF